MTSRFPIMGPVAASLLQHVALMTAVSCTLTPLLRGIGRVLFQTTPRLEKSLVQEVSGRTMRCTIALSFVVHVHVGPIYILLRGLLGRAALQCRMLAAPMTVTQSVSRTSIDRHLSLLGTRSTVPTMYCTKCIHTYVHARGRPTALSEQLHDCVRLPHDNDSVIASMQNAGTQNQTNRTAKPKCTRNRMNTSKFRESRLVGDECTCRYLWW